MPINCSSIYGWMDTMLAIETIYKLRKVAMHSLLGGHRSADATEAPAKKLN